MTTHSIKIDRATQLFYKGAAEGRKITEAHATTEFPDHESRVAFWWYYAGVQAVHEHGCETTEDIENFMRGLVLVAPRKEDDETISDEETE